MSDYKGLDYLRRKLKEKQTRVELRYQFYEMKNRVRDLNISTPDNLKWLNGTLGWCAKGVDVLADRLVFREFRDDNFDMNEIMQMNNRDILFDNAILSALITSCCFIYISPDDTGYPQLQVIDGYNATGELDPVTGLLTEGYAVLKRDSDTNAPLLEAHFIANKTYYIDRVKGTIQTYTHPVGYPLLVPVIYRPDAKRPFGHSRISRACMQLQDAAIRTLKRAEITAEFYSFPQKYVSGVANDYEMDIDRWRATVSSVLMFEQDDEGHHPIIGQFQQQSMTPHIEQFRMMASAFGGETGLTLEDLGFPQDNPSSAEAIKASHNTLQLAARKAQRTFGTGFLNAGYLAACLRDEYQYRRSAIYQTTPIWEPIFEPDAAALSLIGDGAIKINQAIPGFFDSDSLRDLTGVKPAEGATNGGYSTRYVPENTEELPE